MDSSPKPRRKHLRLSNYDYNSSGYYFVTICTHARRCLFGEVVEESMRLNDSGATADQCWRAIPDHFPAVELDRYVVMPNHLHGIIILSTMDTQRDAINRAPTSGMSSVGAQFIAPSLGEVVRAFKARCTVALRRELQVGPLWQRNYYEHVIRSEASLRSIREYILNNQMQWHFDEENPDRVR